MQMQFPPVLEFYPQANPDAVVTVKNARFTVLSDRLIRIEYNRGGRFEDRPSQAFWHRQKPVPVFTKKIVKNSVEIETDYLVMKYKSTLFGLTPFSLSIHLKQNGNTWRYGMPQRRNLKGTARTLDGMGGSTRLENGLLSRSGWAVVDDSGALVFNDNGWLEQRDGKGKDLYFFGYGTDYKACLQDFTNVSGSIPMIPRYILGNWWSRYWKYSQAELQGLVQDFKENEIPLSVCIVDMDWHITKTGNKSDGWTGYTWNRDLFPDPPAFIQWLHSQGLRTALNLHPARGIHPHEQQYEEMSRWMGMDPNNDEPVPFDITDPHFMKGYFEILHHPYEKDGVDFWWMDWQQGRKSKIPGLDPLWLINHLHYYDLGRDGNKRPFVFSRWGGLGNHRYPIGFSGDTFVFWSALAYQPYFTSTAANVAYGWWSHDIGGHMFKDKSPELFLRWVQFGVFSPIFRMHSTSKAALDRRPWSKPERVFHAARDAMQLRHSLIPYIYSMAWRAHCTGVSLVTPMYYGNMEDAAAFDAKDQYYFGSELVVAPVVSPADPKSGLAIRNVWLPLGVWTNIFTGEQVTGGQWCEVKAALEDIPVFAKAGAIIPLAPKVGWGGIDNPSELDIHIFPGKDNVFELYEDDGETTGYLRNQYAITRFTLKHGVFTIHPAQGDLGVIPSSRLYRLHLRGVDTDSVELVPQKYETSTRTLTVSPVRLSPNETYSLKISKPQ